MGIHKKEVVYTISEETATIKMAGDATVEEDSKKINSISVLISKTEDGAYIGNVNYAEIDEKGANYINFNFMGDKNYQTEVETLLSNVIAEIKQETVTAKKK
jgi:hypothetical protein